MKIVHAKQYINASALHMHISLFLQRTFQTKDEMFPHYLPVTKNSTASGVTTLTNKINA